VGAVVHPGEVGQLVGELLLRPSRLVPELSKSWAPGSDLRGHSQCTPFALALPSRSGRGDVVAGRSVWVGCG
jgi:hypothetical protein